MSTLAGIGAAAVSGSGGAQGRRLTWWAFLGVVLVYLAIVQAGGRLIGGEIDPVEGFVTAGNVVRAGLIPIALSAAFAVLVATWLRWWPEIVHEPLRTARWVSAIPIVLLAVAVIGTSWGSLLDQVGEDPESSPLSVLVLPAMIGLAILVWRRHGQIDAGPR